jgi:3-hydroxybutyryl-CoA dehydrogenase
MARRIPIAIVGAGRMGRGIAHAFAYAGHAVRLIDAKPRDAAAFEALRDEALGEIESGLAMLASLGQFDAADIAAIMARITVHPAGDLARALQGAPVIFEGVPETIEAKGQAFVLIDTARESDAVLASTTSTLLSSMLAGLTGMPARFLNAHWLNPAFLVPLVEVSPHDGTDPAATDFIVDLLAGIGKKPVRCKASPGYIVPRIQALAMNEAARLWEEGVASAEDIDTAMRYGFGFRFAELGMLEFIDWGGGDILYYASRYLTEALGDDRFAAPAIIADNMREGRIGMKTGEGFYRWKDRDQDAFRRDKMRGLLGMLARVDALRPPVLD